MEMHNPPHPGRILKGAIENIPMTVTEFAAHIGVSRNTLSRIVNGRGGITPELSIRLSEAFKQGQGNIWFKMQNKYDYWQAAHTKRRKVRPVAMEIAA